MAEARFVDRLVGTYHSRRAIHPPEPSPEEMYEQSSAEARDILNKDPTLSHKEVQGYFLDKDSTLPHKEVQGFIEIFVGADYFQSEVRLLQGQIEDLNDISKDIHDVSTDRDLVKLFLRYMDIFYKDYAFVMKTHPDPLAGGINLEGLQSVRETERSLRIASHRYMHFEIDPIHVPSVHRTRNIRILVAWRMMCLYNWDDSIAHQLTTQDGLTQNLRRFLPNYWRWMVDWSVVIPYELQTLMYWVWRTEITFSALQQFLHDTPSEFRVPTESAWDALMEPYTEEALASDDPDCPICLFEYSQDINIADDEDRSEGAVRTIVCKHVFGTRCLRRWITERGYERTCPKCRTPFFDKEVGFLSWFPGALAHYHNIMHPETGYVAEVKKLSWDTDAFFMKGPHAHTNGQELKRVLERWHGLTDRLGEPREAFAAVALALGANMPPGPELSGSP